MSRFQKGQSIVEFAIVLPFFFLLLFGVIYFGMLFSDYISLNNAARSSAREAEIAASAASDINDVRKRYQGVWQKYQTGGSEEVPLVTSLYSFDPEENLTIEPISASGQVAGNMDDLEAVRVVISAKLSSNSSLASVFRKLMPTVENYTITYQMYQEHKK